MADVRHSPMADTSDGKVIFNAESVAGDLWMRQNYHEIRVELNAREAEAFAKRAKDAGLILENLQAAGT